MGIETILLAGSLAVGAASTIYQVHQAGKAQKAQKEANATQQASAKVTEAIERRRSAKEARIRLARLKNSSSQSGTSDSSGEIGAMGAISASFSEGVAQQAYQTNVNNALTGFNQQVATAQSNISKAGAFTDLFGNTMTLGKELDLFG